MCIPSSVLTTVSEQCPSLLLNIACLANPRFGLKMVARASCSKQAESQGLAEPLWLTEALWRAGGEFWVCMTETRGTVDASKALAVVAAGTPEMAFPALGNARVSHQREFDGQNFQ